VFTSLTPHFTAANMTDDVRKAYIVQYAPDGAVAYRPQADGSRGPAEPQNDERRQFPVVRGGTVVTP
jgi:phytanoyl-CoA hydroxylase